MFNGAELVDPGVVLSSDGGVLTAASRTTTGPGPRAIAASLSCNAGFSSGDKRQKAPANFSSLENFAVV